MSVGAPHRFIDTYVEGLTCVQAQAGVPTKRNGVAEATPLQGGWRTWFGFTQQLRWLR